MQTFRILNDFSKIKSPNNEYYTVKFKIKGKPLLGEGDENIFADSTPFFSGFKTMNKNGNLESSNVKANESTYTIKAWLNMDTYKESIKSIYQPLIESGGAFGEASKLMTLSGTGSLKTKYTSRKVWVDIEAMQFPPINIYFQAETDAHKEVELPIRNLQALVVPVDSVYDDGGNIVAERLFLLPPSQPMIISSAFRNLFKTFGDIAKTMDKSGGASKILEQVMSVNKELRFVKEIQIGNFVSLRNVIIDGIDVDWDISNPDPYGIPLSAKVEVSIIPIDLWTLKTIANFILNRTDGLEFKPVNLDDIVGNLLGGVSDTLSKIKEGPPGA